MLNPTHSTTSTIAFNDTVHAERGFGIAGGLDEIMANFQTDLRALMRAYDIKAVRTLQGELAFCRRKDHTIAEAVPVETLLT